MSATIEIPTDTSVRAVFTTRRGGVSEGPFAGLNLGVATGDRPERVRANRRALCDELGIDADRVSMLRQVHGTGVRHLLAPSRPGRFTGGLRGWPEADALATDRRGLGLVVLAADCLPVILWRRDGSAVAAAHAGWRGLVGGVLEEAVGAVGGEPGALGAAIGPGIGPGSYVVGADVRQRFAGRFGDGVVVGDAVDLAAAARIALVSVGLSAAAIRTVEACTHEDEERFFSYRRDGGTTGRQAGVAWMMQGEG
ncbi:MAG: peptidoglycan editing factor PgeF [Miltoncostaeaceae bacterium]